MSNKTTLQNYNTRLNNNNIDLNTILQRAQKLPDAGSGSTPEDLSQELNAQTSAISLQESKLAMLAEALAGKAAGGGGGGDLPPGYTRVDFIEFTGKQLVDTGIIGNQDTQIDVSFTWGNATQNHIFGCASSDNTASITSYMNGSWRFGAKSASKTISKNNTVLPYAARVNKSMIGVTGSNTAISGVEDFETIGTLLLGGARGSSGALPGSGIVGKAFYFRLWSGSTKIMDLVPVTDGTAYRFYDLVTKTFFDSITETPLEGGNL
jgi:hypothetical protein